MDSVFLPAVVAIRKGDAGALERFLEAEPDLATRRSSCSHPTLMQCLALDGAEHPPEVQAAMAGSLLERGSPIDEPLIAAASIGNVVMARWLLDRGAALDGRADVLGGWSPLEESLYWDQPAITELLLERGAAITTLRAAAGLGRVDEMGRFFDGDGGLRANCGGIRSPFGDFEGEDETKLAQHVLDNSLAYAAMGGHVPAIAELVERGADVTAHPVGFHFRGTALHWAALRGQAEACDWLVAHGADLESRDWTVESTPAGWARHDGHEELARRLESRSR